MITYKPFWETCKRKQISQYDLEGELEVEKSLMHKLRHNLPIMTTSIDKLCKKLHCQPGDIIDYVEDEE